MRTTGDTTTPAAGRTTAGHLIALALLLGAGTAVQAKNVARIVDITLEHVAPGEPGKPGDHNQMRVIYDDAAVDRKTQRARLLNVQHPVQGGFAPLSPDARDMPTDDAWIDLSAEPIRVHYRATVVHGKRIVITLDENARTLTLRSGAADQGLLVSGRYVVATQATSGAEIDLAAGRPRIVEQNHCDSSCLTGLLNRYFHAIAAADAALLPTTADLRATENGRSLPLGEGLWKHRLTAQAYRLDAVDTTSGQAASNAVVLEDGRKVLLFVRLKATGAGETARVSEIETTVVRPGEGQRSDPDRLTTTPALYTQIVPPAQRSGRSELIAAADAYLQALQLAGTPEYRSPPLAPDVSRMENGIGSGAPGPDRPSMDEMLRRGFGTDKLYVSQRRYPVVDESRGVVVAIGLMHVNYGPRPEPPPGQPPRPKAHAKDTPNRLQVLVEFFKVSDGRLREIRAQMLDLDDPAVIDPGWPAP